MLAVRLWHALSGTGNSPASYAVAVNPANTPRAGALIVAGVQFTITQAATPVNAGNVIISEFRFHGATVLAVTDFCTDALICNIVILKRLASLRSYLRC
jgi:hypothetical protein